MSANVSFNTDLNRFYKIKCDPPEAFRPGRNSAGEQILLGKLDDELLVAIFFNADGAYLRYEFYPIIRIPDPTLPVSVSLQTSYIIQETIDEFIQKLGMTPCDIRIRHFAFPDWFIGTAEWMAGDHAEVAEALASGKPFEDEHLIQWQTERRWVLYWRNDFEMSDDGEVLSS